MKKKRLYWPTAVLFLFLIGFVSSIILFVTAHWDTADFSWKTYCLLKITQLIAVSIMFPGFDNWVNRNRRDL